MKVDDLLVNLHFIRRRLDSGVAEARLETKASWRPILTLEKGSRKSNWLRCH